MKIESRNNTQIHIPLSDKKIEQIVTTVAQSEETTAWEKLSLSILFETSLEMRTLNREFRGIDKATDILSFAERDGEDLPFVSYFLGDMVVAPEVVERHAQAYNVSLKYEYTFVLIHGLLHLFGYDHVVDKERVAMRTKEQLYMKKLGFDGVSR